MLRRRVGMDFQGGARVLQACGWCRVGVVPLVLAGALLASLTPWQSLGARAEPANPTPLTGDGLWEGVGTGSPSGLSVADRDNDGIEDDREGLLGLDPANRDTDGDGVLDGLEMTLGEFGFDPDRPDRDDDDDGITAAFESRMGTRDDRPDSDNDGWADLDEQLFRHYGFDPSVASPDSDYDGLTDDFEGEIGSSPASPDTDGDGLSDLVEYEAGLDPAVANPRTALREPVGMTASPEMLAAVASIRDGGEFPNELLEQLPYSEIMAPLVAKRAVRPSAALLLLSLHNPTNSPALYKRYNEIRNEIDRVRRNFGPGSANDIVRVFRWSRPTQACCRGGANHPSRRLYAIKISDRPDRNEDEPEILILAMHHAYELITTEIGVDLLDELTRKYAAGDARTKALVDSAEIWIIPVVNPDGYEHVHATNGWWRKNRRRVVAGQGVFGVDLNRNYGFEHITVLNAGQRAALAGDARRANGVDAVGALVPNAHTYPSERAFTEVETSAVRGLASNAFRNRDGINGLRCTLSLHSYGGVAGHPLAHDVQAGSAQLTAAERASLDGLSAAVAGVTRYLDARGDFEGLRTGPPPGGNNAPYNGYPVWGDSDDWLHRSAGAQSLLVEAYSVAERVRPRNETFFPTTAAGRDAVSANNVRGAVALIEFCTRADFGDADSSHPVRSDQQGARHLENTREWLGKLLQPAADSVTAELDAIDPTDRDGTPNIFEVRERWDLDRHDDGVLFFPLTYQPGGIGRVEFTVCVSEPGTRYDPADSDKRLYVNGWIDWDTDFVWEEVNGEHVVDGLQLAPRDISSWAPVGGGAPATVTQLRSALDGKCAEYAATFPVGDMGKLPMWARFRLDYGEDVGRNNPSPEFRARPNIRLTRGAARYGEVEDYLLGADFGDAPDPFVGVPGQYPTRRQSAGARHLDIHREWLGTVGRGGYPAMVSRETDGCDRTAAESDGVPNLGVGCVGEHMDAKDDGFVVPAMIAPGQNITIEIDVSARVDDFGYTNRGPAGEDSRGRLTMQPNCQMAAIPDAPDTPVQHRDRARYAAWDSARRLYLTVWADWNADGDWTDNEKVIVGTLDPEAWGPDRQYTLGEPFVDSDTNGVRTDAETVTPVAGVATRHLSCTRMVPANVARPAVIHWRARLDYGEDGVTNTAVVATVDERNRTLAGPRGGALWGEVEDQRSTVGEVDYYQHSLVELDVETPQGLFTLALNGPSEFNVDIYRLQDLHGDGREGVAAELVKLDLSGETMGGPAAVRIRPMDRHPFLRGSGSIVEVSNNTGAVLDVPPFAASGTAESCFTVWLEVAFAGEVLHAHEPERFCEMIAYKPPYYGEIYFSSDRLRLFREDETATDAYLTGFRYYPYPSEKEQQQWAQYWQTRIEEARRSKLDLPNPPGRWLRSSETK